MSKPVVLPENFLNEWALPELKPEPLKSVISNPFGDSRANSRVTASGFTEKTILNPTVENSNYINTMYDRSKELSNQIQNEKVWGTKGRRHRHSKEVRDIDRKIGASVGELVDNLGSMNFPQGIPNQDENKPVTMADFTEFTRRISSSIHPNESVSRVGEDIGHEQILRRNMGRATLSGITESDTEIEGTVIGGFRMNPMEKIREIDSYTSIMPVRGLAKIFINERLNFLSHFHNALFRILTDTNGVYPSLDSLMILMESRKTWGDEPSTQLLETVIDSTIDVKSGVVISNPFNLPIIEPTMRLTPKIMHMSLDQLHKEFEIEWFNTMKTLTTPNFQSKYEHRRYSSSRRKSTSSSSKVQSVSSTRSSRRGSSSDAGSAVGSFFGR